MVLKIIILSKFNNHTSISKLYLNQLAISYKNIKTFLDLLLLFYHLLAMCYSLILLLLILEKFGKS